MKEYNDLVAVGQNLNFVDSLDSGSPRKFVQEQSTPLLALSVPKGHIRNTFVRVASDASDSLYDSFFHRCSSRARKRGSFCL